MRKKIIRITGVAGVVISTYIFLQQPSFPTPDKLLIFGTFLAMAFNQGAQFLKRFVPFVVLLLVYESFRGIVPHLNTNVSYYLLPKIDRLMFFGQLPTTSLQNIFWNGQVQWYDFVFYLTYMLHFVLPFVLAVIVWKHRAKEYWRVITTYITVSFAGFLTFLAFPAAPPWMASDMGIIEPITRISSKIWYALGIHDFPSVYNKISPNPVAAMPSLHAAYATIFALLVVRLFKGSRWRFAAWIYPVIIYVGTVYSGEHYAIDEVVGALYALAGFWAAPYILRWIQRTYARVVKRLQQYKKA